MSEYDGYKWIKVKKYAIDETLSWEERYKQLEKHHEEETNFLINEVRKLADERDDLLNKYDDACLEIRQLEIMAEIKDL